MLIVRKCQETIATGKLQICNDRDINLPTNDQCSFQENNDTSVGQAQKARRNELF
jgi:hypothetical protein